MISADTKGGGPARTLLRALLVFALLYFFLVAIKLMGGAFNLLGEGFAKELVSATRSPFTGLFIGILSTAIIQSSSVTTSMVVGLVSVEPGLPLEAAIPIIMGANIGTSVTNTIVSLAHMGHRREFSRAFSGAVVHDVFNWMTVALLLPLEMATGYLQRAATWLSGILAGSGGAKYDSPIKAAVKPAAKAIQHFFTDTLGLSDGWAGGLSLVVALALIFFCLTGLVRLLRALMSARLEVLVHRALDKGVLVTMTIGLLVTAAVQSSSITTSILVPLVATGLIQLEHAFPITLGANLGTTVTALLAALAGNVVGLTAALVHVLFNLSGILILYPIKPIRRIPLAVARWLGETAAERRPLAIAFVAVLFFGIPITVIILERALG